VTEGNPVFARTSGRLGNVLYQVATSRGLWGIMHDACTAYGHRVTHRALRHGGLSDFLQAVCGSDGHGIAAPGSISLSAIFTGCIMEIGYSMPIESQWLVNNISHSV